MGAERRMVVLISAIEHYSYCPRQCALIHVERTYDENVYTMRGTLAHERVHSGGDTTDSGIRIGRSVSVWSDGLGIRGKADLVEFRSPGPYPVEYKLGHLRGEHASLQLCAQALCLEDMLGTPVPRGAVYSRRARRRHEVEIDAELRRKTKAVIREIRSLLQSSDLPSVLNDARCRHCSMRDACLPTVVGQPSRLRGLQSVLFEPWGSLELEEPTKRPADA